MSKNNKIIYTLTSLAKGLIYLFLLTIIVFTLISQILFLDNLLFINESYKEDVKGIIELLTFNKYSNILYKLTFSDYNCLSWNKCHTVFSNFKSDIKTNINVTKHNFKVFDRTFSWFFKGSKPGGGRGL